MKKLLSKYHEKRMNYQATKAAGTAANLKLDRVKVRGDYGPPTAPPERQKAPLSSTHYERRVAPAVREGALSPAEYKRLKDFIRTCEKQSSGPFWLTWLGYLVGLLGIGWIIGGVPVIYGLHLEGPLMVLAWVIWGVLIAVMIGGAAGPLILMILGIVFLPFYLVLGLWERRTVKRLDEAIRQNPASVSLYRKRAAANTFLDRYQDAIQDYDQVVRLTPEADSYYTRGRAHSQAGQYRQAVEDYGEAIGLTPQFGEAHVSRALAYIQVMDLEKARQDMERAVELGVARSSLEEKAKQEAEKVRKTGRHPKDTKQKEEGFHWEELGLLWKCVGLIVAVSLAGGVIAGLVFGVMWLIDDIDYLKCVFSADNSFEEHDCEYRYR